MKRLFAAALITLSSIAFSATLTPIQLLNPAGSTAGQAIVSTGPSAAPAWASMVNSVIAGSGVTVSGATGNVMISVAANSIALSQIAQQSANTVLSNPTASTGNVQAFSMPSCSTSTSALQWTSGTGFTCYANSATTTNTLAQFAATTSAQLAGVISDETGSGSLVFSASPTFTGTPAAPTAAPGTSTTQVATTAFTSNALATYAGTVGRPYFQATLSANQSITANTLTKVQFNTKQFDSNTYYDATTNFRFTPLIAGKYRVTLHVQANETSGGQNIIWLYKNGAVYAQNNLNLTGAPISASTGEINIIVSMNGTTDYIEGYVTLVTGTSITVAGGGPSYPSWFEAYYIGP